MQEDHQSERSYYKLIDAVGSTGKYQTIISILACILCGLNGFMALGTPYNFAVAPYTSCPKQYEGITKCTEYVCSLPPNQRPQYQQPQIRQLSTLGTQFGDYHCEASDTLDEAIGVYVFGGIIGVLITCSLADNIGRRSTLLVSLLSGVIGHVVIQFSSSLSQVSVGMFLLGFGLDSSFNLCICILSEVLSNSERQRQITLVQATFCTAGIIIVIAYYFVQSWRPIFIVTSMIPLVFCLVFTYYFVQ